MIAAAAALLAALVAWPSNAQAQRLLDFTEEERASVARHGPWPPDFERDPSNRVSGDPAAIELGRLLFFAPLLSVDGRIACATCHRADRGWTDGERTSTGLARGVRNAIGLANQRLNRWFGWDGANDSLWAQSLRPLLDPSEMGSTPAAVAAHLRREPELRCHYRAAFGNEPGADDEVILVDAAKALAAFQETIVSARTPFDRFRDSLQRGDAPDAANYPMEAQRGLKLFIGKGQCHLCHFGPNFTNGEFGDVGLPFFIRPGVVDPGRHGGIRHLRASPYSLTGRFTDARDGAASLATRHVALEHRNFGEFRVPSLRELGRTAPYMHDGSLARLRDVVRHYSELNEDRLHADGERILRRLDLAPGEIDDLVAFLRSLTADEPPMPATSGGTACR